MKVYLCLCSLLMVSCIPAAVGTTAKVGYNAAQERSVGAAVDDMSIWTQIKSEYVQEDVNSLLPTINVNVNEGRVLLTGQVRDVQTRIKAVRLAWKPKGVKEVINEIEITDQDLFKTYAKDTWITAQVKSKLILEKEIKSINYTVETDNAIVYLIGIAQNEEELEKATYIASKVKNVRKVISYMRIKD